MREAKPQAERSVFHYPLPTTHYPLLSRHRPVAVVVFVIRRQRQFVGGRRVLQKRLDCPLQLLQLSAHLGQLAEAACFTFCSRSGVAGMPIMRLPSGTSLVTPAIAPETVRLPM